MSAARLVKRAVKKRAVAARKAAGANKTAAMKQLPDAGLGEVAFANPRISEFSLGNIRCFAGEQRVPVRPVTLLVGENSAGKTTFMGAYYMFHRLTMATGGLSKAPQMATFNEPPFHMGAFRDIARKGEGGRGASSHFKLGGAVPFNFCDGSNDVVQVDYEFREDGSEPFVSEALLSFAGGGKMKVERRNIPNSPDGFSHDVEIVIPGARASRWISSERMMHLNEILIVTVSNLPFEDFAENVGGENSALRAFMRRSFRAPKGASDMDVFLRARSLLESKVVAFAPVLSEPKRTYDPDTVAFSPYGGHVPMLLAELSRAADKRAWDWLRGRLADFGRESGLFADFDVRGLGKQSSDPFQIQAKAAGKMSNIVDVGHGVGQIFPLVTHILRETQMKERGVFLLQDPETNLHPQAQAALASFFARATQNNGHTFILETHSDSIIDRVRICVSNGIIPPEDVVILYFEPSGKSGAVKIHPIRLDENANLLDAPPGYRDFFIRESDYLLGFEKLPKS